MNSIFLIVSVLIIASISPFIIKNEKWVRLSSVIFSFIAGFLVFSHVVPVFLGNVEPWHDSYCFIDRFSSMMASLVAFVYIVATFISSRYIDHEHREGLISLKTLRIYFSLLHIFVLSMILTVVANNSLLLWISLEGTTLASTFLVGLYRRKASVEAAWKYIIICSTGISLGLVGILLLGYGSHVGGMKGIDIFMLTSLTENASIIPVEIVRLAFVLILVGFGAKVGFAPMHTWLPDAHGNAPSPISAIFSGVLLNVALYVIIRFKFIVDISTGSPEWTNNLFMFFGAISIIIPAFMMLVQNNYKRMLAYSSVEHMGLISFAISISPFGIVASLIHMVGHTLTKSLLFFGAGEILLGYKTTKTEKIQGLIKYFPYTGIMFLLGILAIIALPPSALFVSEFTMFAGAIPTHPWVSLAIFASLSVIAFAMLRSTLKMFSASEDSDVERVREKWNITHSVMAFQLVILVVFGVWVSSSGGFEFFESIARDIVYINAK